MGIEDTPSWITISEQLDFLMTRNNVFIEVLVEKLGYAEVVEINNEVEKRQKELNLKRVK